MDISIQGRSVALLAKLIKHDLKDVPAYGYVLQKPPFDARAVSTHLPRGTRLLGREEFAAFTGGKLLLNTSLGDTFDRAALKEWLAEDGDNYYLCDGCGIGDAAPELEGLRGVLLTHRGSGASLQMNQRLSRKVLDNALAFLQGR